MNRDSCQTIEDLLVDFADGALTGADEQCPHCRETVEALRQSLAAAETIWQDNAGHVARAPRSRKWHYVAAAASIALAVGTLLYRPTPPQPAPSAPTLAEIENDIATAGRAARLLARVDQLETQTSLQHVAASQYRYIAERYPDTVAAASAQLKLKSLP